MNMRSSIGPSAIFPYFARMAALSVLTVAAAAASFSAAAAPVVSVATRAALNADDSVVWTGDDGVQASSNPYTAASSGGINVTASASDLWLFKQNGAGGYAGSFSDGDRLLTTFFDNGPLTLSFDKAVRGVGFNIENVNWGDFTGTMEFFNAGNLSLGFVTVTGTNSGSNDGSAPFLGGLSDLLEISKVVISVSTVLGGEALTINQVSLVTTGTPGTVPEPGSVLLVATALVGLILLRRRRAAQVA